MSSPSIPVAEESISFVRQLENRKTNKIPDTITFECELSVDGATVEWTKADRPIKKGDKYEITARGTVHRLTINDVDGKDSGDYAATYKNRSTKATLAVEGEFSAYCLENYRARLRQSWYKFRSC